MDAVILEDEPMVGGLLASWLRQSFPDWQVHVTQTAPQAVEAVSTSAATLLLTDLIVGGTWNGIDVGIAVKEIDPAIGVIVITSYRYPQLLRRIPRAVSPGWAYLLKGRHDPAHLAHAITRVQAGDLVLDGELLDGMHALPESPLALLSPTELDVVKRVAEGWSNTAIASDRGLTVKSVEHSLSHAYGKLGIDSHNRRINPRVQVALAFCEYSAFPTGRRL